MKAYPIVAWFVATSVAAYAWFPDPFLALAVGVVVLIVLLLAGRQAPSEQPKIGAATVLVGAGLHLLARVSSWSMIPPEPSLVLGKFLFMATLAATAVVMFPWLSQRFPTLIPIELSALGAPVIWSLSGHQEASMDRPSWFAEPILSSGMQTTPVLYLVGVTTAIVLLGVYSNRVDYHIKAKTMMLPVLAAVCLILWLFEHHSLPPLEDRSIQQNVARSSTQENEQDDSSHPVALVVFYEDYSPELGSYYFRTAISDSVQSRNKTLFASLPLRLRIAVLTPELPEINFERTSERIPSPNPDPKKFRQVYELRCQTPENSYEDCLQDEPPTLNPKSNPEVQGLALEAVNGKIDQSPLALGFLVQTWLEKNRSQAAGTLVDDLNSFLLKNQAGTQRVFAEACAELTSSLGIKSRTVHGFSVPSRLRGNGSFLLIESQHERWWCEIWVPSRGWTVLDPVALDSPMSPKKKSSRQLQTELGEAVRTASVPDKIVGLPTPLVRVLSFLAALCILGYVVKIFRQLQPYWLGHRRLTYAAYLASLDTLAGLGMVRQEGETRLAFAERISSEVPSFEGLTALHLQSVWGKPATTPTEAIFRTLGQVKQDIRRSFPLKRRILGALNPFNWTNVR